MKKLLISLTAATLLLHGYYDDYYYHQDNDKEHVVSTTTIINQTIVNDIITDSISIDTQTQTSETTSTQKISNSVQIIKSDDISLFNIPLSMSIGSDFGIDLNLPVVNNDIQNETGIGDISLGVNYRFGKISDSLGFNKTTFRYKTTSGDENKGLGSGASALTLTHKYAKDVGNDFNLHLMGTYTLNDTSDKQNIDYGDAYTLMIGAEHPCLLSKDVQTSAKLTYFNSDKNKVNSFEINDDVKNIDLWLSWNSDKLLLDLPIGFGVKIPLVNEVGGHDTDKTTLFYLSVSSLF